MQKRAKANDKEIMTSFKMFVKYFNIESAKVMKSCYV